VSLAGVFAPGVSLEQVQGQDVVTTQPTVYYLPGTDVDAVDAVTVNGLLYEVDGEPNVWPPSPFTGWQPEYSVEVRLKKVTGGPDGPVRELHARRHRPGAVDAVAGHPRPHP
jgi:hypothetical protein